MKELLKRREVLTISGVLLLLLVVALFDPNFVSAFNLSRTANSAVILILLAAGVTPVIITKNIDVSVGAILALSGILGAKLLVAGTNMWLVILFIAGLGAILGAINGAIVTYGHVPSIVATLGTMSVYRGVSFLITGGYSIENIPRSFSRLGSVSVAGIPILVISAVVLVILLTWFLGRTRWGRYVYATGGNEEGAHLIGIRTDLITIMAFAFSGLFAGLAAVVFIAQIGSISNQAGVGMEMSAIAAAVIGGVALTGGVGTVVGSMFGALFITTATSAMQFMGVPGFWSNAVIGAVLLIALFADAMVRRSMEARRIAERYRRDSEPPVSPPAVADLGTNEGEAAQSNFQVDQRIRTTVSVGGEK